MKKPIKILAALVAVGVVALAVWGLLTRGSASPSESADEAPTTTARVEVAPIQRKTLRETVTAYGSVVAKPGRTHAVTVAFETRVRHVLVAPGQSVAKGDPLVEIEPSPAARLQLQQAQAAADAAQTDLKQVRQRYDLKLATNADLNAAEKVAKDAALQLESLRGQGVGEARPLVADLAGIVIRVDTQDGQIATAGAPLVELVAEGEIEVKLGVEPDDIGAIQPGDPIELFPVNDAALTKVAGAARLVTRSVDPTTRLVDVYVSLPAGTPLLFGAYVRGEIARAAKDALVVPRSAVLPADGGQTLFTVKDGHAVQHLVHTGLESDAEIQVLPTFGLQAGESVVVTGNYELEDGMPVEVPAAQ
jgi:RND family efflux transporter MFP subunit